MVFITDRVSGKSNAISRVRLLVSTLSLNQLISDLDCCTCTGTEGQGGTVAHGQRSMQKCVRYFPLHQYLVQRPAASYEY